jgi:GDSL-like Lipase/Acylhydrolase family
MSHIVLLGDSIFDNAAYVAAAPAVIDQVRSALSIGWKSTLLAVDGNVALDVREQLNRVPSDATHLVMSVGGNDALGVLTQLHSPTPLPMMQALRLLADIQTKFASDYAAILKITLALKLPILCCTIYDQVPGLTQELRTALSTFNDVILRECARHHVSVLDLRSVCTDATDYSVISPIEPSNSGGQKIAFRIVSIVLSGTLDSKVCQIHA